MELNAAQQLLPLNLCQFLELHESATMMMRVPVFCRGRRPWPTASPSSCCSSHNFATTAARRAAAAHDDPGRPDDDNVDRHQHFAASAALMNNILSMHGDLKVQKGLRASLSHHTHCSATAPSKIALSKSRGHREIASALEGQFGGQEGRIQRASQRVERENVAAHHGPQKRPGRERSTGPLHILGPGSIAIS